MQLTEEQKEQVLNFAKQLRDTCTEVNNSILEKIEDIQKDLVHTNDNPLFIKKSAELYLTAIYIYIYENKPSLEAEGVLKTIPNLEIYWNILTYLPSLYFNLALVTNILKQDTILQQNIQPIQNTIDEIIIYLFFTENIDEKKLESEIKKLSELGQKMLVAFWKDKNSDTIKRSLNDLTVFKSPKTAGGITNIISWLNNLKIDCNTEAIKYLTTKLATKIAPIEEKIPNKDIIRKQIEEIYNNKEKIMQIMAPFKALIEIDKVFSVLKLVVIESEQSSDTTTEQFSETSRTPSP